MRRHRRVPHGHGNRRFLLHRGQSPRAGRTHRDRRGHRHRHRARADPHHRGQEPRGGHRRRLAIRREARRPRHSVPDHHRGPDQQLYPRLRPHHRLSRGDRHGHPPRRRHGLFGRRHHALLRQPAGEGHRMGAHARGRDRADGPRAARVSHPGCVDQHRLRREPAEAPDLPELPVPHQVHRRDARAVRFQAAPGPRDAAPDVYRRHHRERASRDRGTPPVPAPTSRTPSRHCSGPTRLRWGPASFWTSTGPRRWRNG